MKLERQLASNWLLNGERHLPRVRHTSVCVAASGEHILIYDGNIDVLFILDTKPSIINYSKGILNLNLAETSPIRYRSFFLLTEGRTLVLFYEQFHKKHNMTHRCMVKGEVAHTLISIPSPTALSGQDMAVPQIKLQNYIETEIRNYEKTRGAILCDGIVYALIQEPLAPKCSVAIYSISKVNESNRANWEIILRNVGRMYFFIYKHQLFSLEFDSHNSVIYHFLPGQPHRIKYVYTEVPLQTERNPTNIYANKGLVYTASDKVLLRLTRFISPLKCF